MDYKKQAAIFDYSNFEKNIQNALTNKDIEERASDLESNPLTPQIITKKPGAEVPVQPTVQPPVQPTVSPKTPEQEYKETLQRKQPAAPKPVKKPPIEERAPEFGVLNQFFPSIVNQAEFDVDADQHKDSSLTVLEYLKSMGYKRGTWVLGPEWDANNCHLHRQYIFVTDSYGNRTREKVSTPICLARAGNTYSIDAILKNAQNHAEEHGYSPAKPIIALSHPSCNCNLVFPKPTNYQSIPDNAPGLPMYADKKSLTNFKKELYDKLTEVTVNRWSFIAQKDIDEALPYTSKQQLFNVQEREKEKLKKETERKEFLKNQPEESTYAELMDVIRKTADQIWEEDIRPIRLTQNFMYYQFPGILTPVPKSYIGFQLAKTDKIAKIYLTALGHTIDVPKTMLDYLEFVPTNEKADANSFIEIDGEYGIILQAKEYEKPVCYIPAFEDIMTVDGDYQTLKAIG